MRMVTQTGGRVTKWQPMSRRPIHKPLRYTPHHDEYVPPLTVLQRWNASPVLPICVAKIDGKGFGVVARRTLPSGTIVARYEFRVVSRGHAPPGDYRVDVTRYLVGKLDARSFGPPVEGVANVGPLLNEATTRSGEVTNCARTASELTGSQGHRRGAFFLRTTREVHVGQELMWDYGANYGPRSYQ